MRIKFTGNGLRKGVALLLVGTIAGGVSYGRVVSATSDDAGLLYNDFLKGYYSDEDVKRNKEELMSSIELAGKAKTLEKKRDIVPKTIKR